MSKIHALLIFEILGRPAEHVKESLNLLIDRVAAEKGVKLLQKKIHDPLPAKESSEMFTSFAEIEVELDSLDNYFGLVFSYMPSHIEIATPENFTLTNAQFSELANQIISRLHNYDAVTKRALIDREKVLDKLREVAPHLFRNAPGAAPAVKSPEGKKSASPKTKTQKNVSKKTAKKKS